MNPPEDPVGLGSFVVLTNVILASACSPGHARCLIWRRVPCDVGSTPKFGECVLEGAERAFQLTMDLVFDVHQMSHSANDNARKLLLTGVSIVNRGERI